MPPIYQDLETGNFRLLAFLDDTGLSCGLESYRLEEAPPYIALSYTWGQASYQKGRPSSLTYSITLNNQRREVQQNLHDALSHLGHRVRRRQCLFWVDALCINQENLDERNAQVGMMKAIYEQANGVFAWLGVPFNDEETRSAVKLMHDFNVFLYEGLKKFNDDIDSVLAMVTKHHAGFPSDESTQVWIAWNGIAEMLNQPYWHRVWIYQEATTPGHIHFFCGTHVFDDIVLSATISLGLTFSRLPAFDVRFIQAAGHASSAAALSTARTAREKGKNRKLIGLMLEVKKTTCTDPKDKVYAPLGHATDVAPGQISIDYRKSLIQVYIEVARFAFFHSGMTDLEALGLVFTPADDASHKYLSMCFVPQMPSWVPDWRQRVTIPRLANSDRATEDGMPLYSPSPGTRVQACIHGTELELMGHIADALHIETLTNIWDDDEGSSLTPRAWYDTLIATNPPQSDIDHALRRTLVGDKSRALHGSDKNDFSPTWKRGGMLDWTLLDSERTELDQASLNTLEGMFNDMMNVCYGRRMARFTNGRIGILPAAAKMGDQVAAFHGGHALYLVRPLAHRSLAYKFVGECYVDGLMDGAFTDLCNAANKCARLLRLV